MDARDPQSEARFIEWAHGSLGFAAWFKSCAKGILYRVVFSGIGYEFSVKEILTFVLHVAANLLIILVPIWMPWLQGNEIPVRWAIWISFLIATLLSAKYVLTRIQIGAQIAERTRRQRMQMGVVIRRTRRIAKPAAKDELRRYVPEISKNILKLLVDELKIMLGDVNSGIEATYVIFDSENKTSKLVSRYPPREVGDLIEGPRSLSFRVAETKKQRIVHDLWTDHPFNGEIDRAKYPYRSVCFLPVQSSEDGHRECHGAVVVAMQKPYAFWLKSTSVIVTGEPYTAWLLVVNPSSSPLNLDGHQV